MLILHLNDYKKENFIIKKYEKNRLNMQYNNNKFIFEPEIAFDNCSLFTDNNPYKIRFNINLSDIEHLKFKELIYIFYEKIKDYIKKDGIELLNMRVMDPLNTSNVLFDTKILYSIINKSTIIKNFDNDMNLNINDLIDKRFVAYPSFFSPNINVYNKKLYINFTLNMIYIKVIKENIENKDYIETIKYDNVAEAINTLMLNNKT